MAKRPEVPVAEKELPEGLRLETQAWRVEIARNPFAVAFTNKLTGIDWKLAGVRYVAGGEPGPPTPRF